MLKRFFSAMMVMFMLVSFSAPVYADDVPEETGITPYISLEEVYVNKWITYKDVYYYYNSKNNHEILDIYIKGSYTRANNNGSYYIYSRDLYLTYTRTWNDTNFTITFQNLVWTHGTTNITVSGQYKIMYLGATVSIFNFTVTV